MRVYKCAGHGGDRRRGGTRRDRKAPGSGVTYNHVPTRTECAPRTVRAPRRACGIEVEPHWLSEQCHQFEAAFGVDDLDERGVDGIAQGRGSQDLRSAVGNISINLYGCRTHRVMTSDCGGWGWPSCSLPSLSVCPLAFAVCPVAVSDDGCRPVRRDRRLVRQVHRGLGCRTARAPS